MNENWYALFLSIVKGISVEAAFLKLRPPKDKIIKNVKPSKKRYQIFPDEDIEKMIELKKTMTYKQVGEIFNTDDRNIYLHIKKYKPGLINSGVLAYKKSRSSDISQRVIITKAANS